MKTHGYLREPLFYLRILTITSVLSISLQIYNQVSKYIGRKYFWSFRTPKGKKRKVKSESDWKKYYGSCPELKEDIERLGRQNFSRTILSLHKTPGKANFEETKTTLPTTSLQSPLTQEYQDTTIVTSSAGTSEKIIMKETIEIVDHMS